MRILRKVYDEIARTIGSRRPEEGGMLLTSDGGLTITKFIFDDKGSRSGSTYTPNIAFLNEHIKKQNNKGYYFVGIVHSHPNGFTTLSMGRMGGGFTASDEEAIYKLLDGMKGTKKLYFPVVQSSAHGKFSMRMFYGERMYDNRIRIGEETIEIVEEVDDKQKQAIQSLIPTKRYGDNTAILIGAGSAVIAAEQLAARGIHKFILVDGAKYSNQDFTRGLVGWQDVGTYIADGLARKIQYFNPTTEVKVIRQFVDKEVDAKLFEQWTEGINKSRSLVLLCNSDPLTTFYAKQLAAKIKIPLLHCYKNNGCVRTDHFDYFISDKAQTYDFSTLQRGHAEFQIINSVLVDKAMVLFGSPIVK